MIESGMSALVFPYGEATSSAQIKLYPEDFRVSEELGFELTGNGEHLFLYVQKSGLTTQQLTERISKIAGIHPRNIGYSGLKDKQAVTQQWISLHLPGCKQPPDIPNTEDYQILQSQWHDKKLRVGVHRSNHFDITLRNIKGDLDKILRKIGKIEKQGFANYFGSQRFGTQQDNVAQALRVLNNRHKSKRLGRHKKSLYLSALRSELFNRILSRRIELGFWDHPVQGDTYTLAGSQSLFNADIDDEILQRYAQFDIHSALSLYGSGDSRIADQALNIENEVVSSYPGISDTLIASEIKRSYRASRAIPRQLKVSYEPQQNSINLKVELAKGVYLTTLLDHFVDIAHY